MTWCMTRQASGYWTSARRGAFVDSDWTSGWITSSQSRSSCARWRGGTLGQGKFYIYFLLGASEPGL